MERTHTTHRIPGHVPADLIRGVTDPRKPAKYGAQAELPAAEHSTMPMAREMRGGTLTSSSCVRAQTDVSPGQNAVQVFGTPIV